MKKLLPFKTIVILLLLVGISTTSWAQILYEGFDYATPAVIGGTTAIPSSSNNWTTHSGAGTINIENGNLSYTGLASSTGNKVNFFSNANANSRDINRGFTSTATTLYFSVLVNVIDLTQLTVTGDYFIHFGAFSGDAGSIFGARTGAKLSADGTHFRFMILNTSGGTPVYADNGTDLNFGTTYLLVVKYDISAAITVATMWVNPSSLGGTEPTGGITNNTGTGAFASFGSICLRNSGTTPKAFIDEIRVGATWASVTPTGNVGISKKEVSDKQTSIYPNPAKAYFNVKASEGKYVVSVTNSIGAVVKTANLNSTGKVETSDLRPGVYYVTVENVKTNLREIHKLIVK